MKRKIPQLEEKRGREVDPKIYVHTEHVLMSETSQCRPAGEWG